VGFIPSNSEASLIILWLRRTTVDQTKPLLALLLITAILPPGVVALATPVAVADHDIDCENVEDGEDE
jgi:hypothetical protein